MAAYLHCDNCGIKGEQSDEFLLRTWLTVEPVVSSPVIQFGDNPDEGPWHFCSARCVGVWASDRNAA